MSHHDDAGPQASDVPSDADIAEARQSVESTIAKRGMSLDDPALWLQPGERLPADLLTPEARADAPTWGLRHPWRWTAAAAVLIAALSVVVFSTRDRPTWSVQIDPNDDFPLAEATIDGWTEGTGTRMRLEITGLDPAPEGFFYEMWMSEGPVHVSAGTFAEVDNIELRAAVSLRDYPRLWVTLEPIDDDESPTRVVVLDTGG